MNELTEGIDALSTIRKYQKESEEIEQILGKALGYPWFKDDPKNFPNATEADGVCVAPNTAASLAMHAADKIKMLDIREQDKQKIIDEQREEIARAAMQDGFESGYQIGYKSGLAAFNKE